MRRLRVDCPLLYSAFAVVAAVATLFAVPSFSFLFVSQGRASAKGGALNYLSLRRVI
jgi:hypothetical protein